ncbi:helix-turn-helix transcriptional regulator [Salmonella enterica]|nr:helix-turn-helix transcriptional regulator [Salmonella enterica]EBL8185131.1 XRE family transcriptional regulator [Salmonella enterica]EJG3783155.1 helix-turn-helix transcriptional regulator [Salmonella enterica]EJM0405632.1 helix-turn-helix transcriptional regulator [Salmonella enterica]EKH2732047.1 helix-turn-helix transcriptional regulator [Salmonella enterica]
MDTVFPVILLSQLRPLLIGFRKSKGLTQRELSARLGVTQQTYARLEANPSKASFERLYKVLNILEVEISLISGPLSTDTKSSDLVEKEFDSPARREEW